MKLLPQIGLDRPIDRTRRTKVLKCYFVLLASAAVCGIAFHNPQAQAAEPQSLQVWWGTRGQLGDEFERLVEQFNKSQNRIVVEVRRLNGYGDVNRELNRAFEDGELPDVAVVEIHSVASFAADNRIQALDGFIKHDPTFQPDDLLPGLLMNLRYQKTLYALPMNRSTPILYYNKNRFASAGLDPDKPPKTWEQLSEMSRRLTNKDGSKYGFVAGSFAWLFESMVWGAGGELVEDKNATFAAPGTKPLQLWADMVHQDKTARFVARGNWFEEFSSGRAAMMIESTALLQLHTANANFEVGTALVPYSDGFRNAVPTGGGAAVIPAGIPLERQAAAWKFLTWFTSTKQTADFSRATGYIPLRKSARTLLRKEGFYEKHPEFETAILQMEYAREAPNLKHWSASWKVIEEAMTLVVRDDAPAFETLKAAEVKTGTLLKSGVVPDP